MSFRRYGDAVEPPRVGVERALRAWAEFPAARDPRPLVLLSSLVNAGGFPDAQTKRACLDGAVDGVPGFPAELLEMLRTPGRDHRGRRLLMTDAARASAEFLTDRGPRELPAWVTHAEGVPEPIIVLDWRAAQRAWWPPGDDLQGWRGSTAVLADQGHQLTMTFSGTPVGYADYLGAELLEQGAAVAIVPAAVDIGPAGPRRLYAQKREVTVRLSQPLGARLVLDQHGAPVMVDAGPVRGPHAG